MKHAPVRPPVEGDGVTLEAIAHKRFGKDGFDDAVEEIAALEQASGHADLGQSTAPSPPHS
jgi:hypothetical protein